MTNVDWTGRPRAVRKAALTTAAAEARVRREGRPGDVLELNPLVVGAASQFGSRGGEFTVRLYRPPWPVRGQTLRLTCVRRGRRIMFVGRAKSVRLFELKAGLMACDVSGLTQAFEDEAVGPE